jgi:hypothetical protein
MLHDANGLLRHSEPVSAVRRHFELNFSKASFVVARRRIRLRLFGLNVAITTCSRDNIKKHSKIDAIIGSAALSLSPPLVPEEARRRSGLCLFPTAYKTHEHVLKSYFRIPDCS